MSELEDNLEHSPPIWAVFGDLMSGLVGVLVLVMVWFLGYQFELARALEKEAAQRERAEQQALTEERKRIAAEQSRLQEERRRIAAEQSRIAEEQRRREAEQRRVALEEALAGPLASGRVTLQNGRIGISGSVLFSLNSDKLQEEGRTLLRSLIAPLQIYLSERNELLMVSGFTDDLPIQKGNSRYTDNWELSAQRALTVTRSLIEQGMPSSMVFAAAFGAEQPAVPNTDDASRSQNRRVEMAPVPRASKNPETAEHR